MLNIHLWRNPNIINANQAAGRSAGKNLDLSRVTPGKQVTITGFGSLSATHRQHLQAYGVLPGRTVTVLAQAPVTIILVEQTELAFEAVVARQVMVE